MSEPEEALRDYLAGAGLGLTTATNLFAGPERPGCTTACVFCLQTGGPPPEDDLGSGWSLVRHSVQVMVRSAVRAYAEGRALAKGALKAAHQATISGYFGVSVLQSNPMYLGEDDDGHHRWSFHVEMDAKEQV